MPTLTLKSILRADITSLLGDTPATIWHETIRLEQEFAEMMKDIRYQAFAAEWQKGKTVNEIAEILQIPISNVCVFSTRIRTALGEKAIPRRNATPPNFKAAMTRRVKPDVSALQKIGDYFEMPAQEAMTYNTTYVRARRAGWKVSITKNENIVRVLATTPIENDNPTKP